MKRDAVVEAPPAPLTDRQAEVYSVVAQVCAATGEGCSASLIARRLHLHHETIREHFAALYRKGWLISGTSPAIVRDSFLAR